MQPDDWNVCQAGRSVLNPNRIGWQEPCPNLAEHTLVVRMDDGYDHAYRFCTVHYRQLPS